jgi:hypothetical protein
MAVPLLLQRGSQGGPPMYASVAREAAMSLLAMVAAVVFPAAQGALRIAVTGTGHRMSLPDIVSLLCHHSA